MRSFNQHRIAVVGVNDLTWNRFEMPLEDHSIDWTNPQFLDHDSELETFIKKQKSRYPKPRSELTRMLGRIDKVWLVRGRAGYEYRIAYEPETRRS